MIFSCSNKMKSEESSGAELKQPSGAGMTDDEIKNLPFDELINLKNSITNYLKCRKLKNRNNEFLNLYMKINKEFIFRSNSTNTVKKQIFETKVERSLCNSIITCEGSTKTLTVNSLYTEKKGLKKTSFLKRKFSFSKCLLDLVFPSFLNDKSKLIQMENKQIDENSQVSSEYFEDDLSCKNSNVLKTKRCIKGSLLFK